MTTDFVDRIYEASFVPELWPNILLDIAKVANSKGGLLLSTRDKSLNWTASDNIREAFADYLEGGWFRRCGRRVCLLEKAHASFLREEDYWSEDEIEKNDIYQEFFYPRNLGWSAGTGLVMPTGDHIVFSIERARQDGPIEAQYVDVLNDLRPHIARATMVAARMGLQSATTAKDAFTKLSVPTILLDLNGTCIESSTEVAAQSDHITWGPNDALILKDSAANTLLHKALSEIHSQNGVQSFAIKDDNGLPAHVAHVIPITRAAHDIFAKGYALLVLNPIDTKTNPSVDLLRSLFDFTAAEANVARQLANGVSAEKIAENGGVSINTVRTQIRKIIEKSGCNKLPEVISMISNLSLER